jgi:hypothetical protein
MSKIITNNITPRSGSSVGLTGDLVSSGSITGTTGTFSGSVSVGGTITYEDVTNVDSVGVITARSDVSIADKIIHTGDTNTAIRFPAADTFTVETAGSERVRVTSSGYLGIGAGSNTNKPLHIYTGASDSEIRLQTNSGVEQNSYITLRQSSGDLDFYTVSSGTNMKFHTVNSERLRITSAGAAIFKGGLAEKYENAGTTLGAQSANPLSDGNVILFTGNESGNKTINFTGVHATLSNGETVSFTAIITPNNSGVINVVQVDGQAITVKWSGGSVPTAGASGQDIYTFQILKTGTGTSDYTVFGAATNYA